jgi:hypothetical protein
VESPLKNCASVAGWAEAKSSILNENNCTLLSTKLKLAQDISPGNTRIDILFCATVFRAQIF